MHRGSRAQPYKAGGKNPLLYLVMSLSAHCELKPPHKSNTATADMKYVISEECL